MGQSGFAFCGAGRWVRGCLLDGGKQTRLRPQPQQCGGRTRTQPAWDACPPACAGLFLLSPSATSRPRPPGLRWPLWPQSSQGMRTWAGSWEGKLIQGRAQGRSGETEAAGGCLGGPTASPICHATEPGENQEEAPPAQSNPPRLLGSSWPPQGYL